MARTPKASSKLIYRWYQTSKRFLREVAVVVIGVLIAVGMNNYQETKQREAYLAATLGSINKELDANSEEIRGIMERHYAIVEAIGEDTLASETLAACLQRMGGVQAPYVKNIGLRFFVTYKAEIIEFEIISRLSEIETNGIMLNEKIQRLTHFAYEKLSSTAHEDKEKFAYLLLGVIDTEETLLALYADFKKQHDE